MTFTGADSTSAEPLVCSGPVPFRSVIRKHYHHIIVLWLGYAGGAVIGMAADRFDFGFLAVESGILVGISAVWVGLLWIFWRTVYHQEIIFDRANRVILFRNFAFHGYLWPRRRQPETVVGFEDIVGFRISQGRDDFALYIATSEGVTEVLSVPGSIPRTGRGVS